MAGEALSQFLLVAIDSRGCVDTLEFAKESSKDHQQIVGAVKSLQTLGNVSDWMFRKLYLLRDFG